MPQILKNRIEIEQLILETDFGEVISSDTESKLDEDTVIEGDI
jgi:hypothetical protein